MPVLATTGEAKNGLPLVPAAPVTWSARRPLRWLGERWPTLLALAVALPIAVPTFRGTLDWIGQPFPGFFVMGNRVVPTVGLYSWTGLGGGVPFHARVMAVDGAPIASNADVYRMVAERPVGTPMGFTLEKGGHTFTRTIPSMRFGLRDWWLTVGLFAVFGVFSIAMGTIVGVLQPRLRAAHAFLIQGILTGLYALTGSALYHPALEPLSRLHHLAQGLFPAAFIHLGLTFPVTREFVRREPAWLLAPYVVGALISLWVYTSFYGEHPNTLPLYVSYLWAALAIGILIALVAYAYRENRTPMVRHQLRIVLPGLVAGTGLGFVGYLDNMRAGGSFPINLIAIAPFVFYASVAYAIARRELFDVDTFIRQSVVYLTLTAMITLLYVVTVTAIGLLSPGAAGDFRPLDVAFVVAIALLFQPLRGAAQRVVDRTFFRNRPDYRAIVHDVSTALPALLDLDRILATVETTLRQGFQLRSLAVVLWPDDGSRLWRYERRIDRLCEHLGPPLEGLRAFLEREPGRVWMVPDAELAVPDASTASDIDEAAQAELVDIGAVLVLPIAAGETLLGALAVGPRAGGVPFSAADLDLLGTVAAQASIAIQNALSYRQVQDARGRLEERVRERTAELERSTAELEVSNAELARSKLDLETALEELRSTQAQLLQTEKLASLGQLVAGVAHEINNPVTFIVGNIEPIQDELDVIETCAGHHRDADLASAAQRIGRMVGLIREGAERTAGIVQDLRTFSRVGGAVPHPTDVNEGMDVTVRLLRPKWGSRVMIHRDYGTLPAVLVVPGQLNQVFMNLLANACDAIADRGNIWIATFHEDEHVRVTIRDDGSGIAPEHMGRIFDPFFTTKPQGQGTGLGLAITYGIVQAHAGRVEVESRPGEGTTVSVVLPVHPPATPAPAPEGGV